MKIDGSVAVVTGAGSGIGRSIAAALASAGSSVVAADIDAASVSETAAMIGHFVAVSSACGLLTQLGFAPYSVTKHAAVAFAEWLAITYGDDGIGVSCVCPMGVDTALLRGMVESLDPQIRAAGASVTGAGAVIGADTVADMVVKAIAEGTFLVLPHPEVLTMYRRKGSDYQRWIAGMRRYKRTFG